MYSSVHTSIEISDQKYITSINLIILTANSAFVCH